jgi:uncharacterized protein YecE (DUF72 family)
MRAPGQISIGTSGWTYDAWRGPFYPDATPKSQWLGNYASVFSSTEINGAFYRTPSLEAVRRWRDQTPPGFRFAWKASKFMTHWKRLTEKCENSIALMETRLVALEPKVAAVLFQLPPQFSKNCERLRGFLPMLSPRRRYAFEFRHVSWYDDEVLELLRRHNVALCISDHAHAPAPWQVTADHIYIRGHGPKGQYAGSYPARTLRNWADFIAAQRRHGRDVLVYFDNDQKAAAPKDAVRLMRMIGREAAASPPRRTIDWPAEARAGR